MGKSLSVVIAVALAVCCACSCFAAPWSKIGSSAFATTTTRLQDANRVLFNSIVIDAAGNIYATANNARNSIYTYTNLSGAPYLPPPTPAFTQLAGGLTIFKPDNSKIDIQVSDFSDPGWSQFRWGPNVDFATYGGRTDNRFVGEITKLVLAGDGKVYGLMNYREIGFDTLSFEQNMRIVRVNPNGTIENIWAAQKPYTGNGSGAGTRFYKQSGSTYSWADTGCIIKGMTVAGDGNVYWTANDDDGYFKYHFLWRYNVTSHAVEEAPINVSNNGFQEAHRIFNLQYVGMDPDDAENPVFGVVWRTKDSGNAWTTIWRLDPMAWKTNRPDALHPRENGDSGLNGDTPGRDWITAIAYDPVYKKLWAAGRGDASHNMFTKWSGDPTESNGGLLFHKESGEFWIPRAPSSQEVNGNTDGVSNGGKYWVSALAVNPVDSRAWVAFGADANYNYDPTGYILTWDPSSMLARTTGNEGVPETDSYTVGLTFKGEAAYALVCNKTTGIYSVYTKSMASAIGGMKHQTAGSGVITDVPKAVTYASPDGTFFYIEEDDRSSGIKVMSAPGAVVPIAGDRVKVIGTIDTIDGEATIAATSNDLDGSGTIAALSTAVGNIGGLQSGLQPDTPAIDARNTPDIDQPQTLNTTGLLVRVVGKVFGSDGGTGFYLDDGSGYGLWVDYTDAVVANGAVVGVAGVSSVRLNGTGQAYRVIRALPELDPGNPNLVVYKAP